MHKGDGDVDCGHGDGNGVSRWLRGLVTSTGHGDIYEGVCSDKAVSE